ncbi:class I SAM-dependent methyltransferase [Alteribacter aurantiacus]|uniref:class I SAM-dependent methyltransferase n=1 Tax=Alteribacter aurantiacus TaxID=254410 RepID=UPI0004289103|nr:class I SAM-dependent methyltransferase [Alteribacter aurantiacus]
MALYNQIGSTYDISRKADAEIVNRLVYLLQLPTKEAKLLDVACGTGNYTVSLEEKGYTMSGLDLSETMLDQARQKSDTIQWFCGDVKQYNLPQEQFEGATCVLGVHHFDHLYESFANVYRSLKPGSRFVIFTSGSEQMQRYWLNAYFPEMMKAAMGQMPLIREIAKALKKAGFTFQGSESFLVQPSLEDAFLYVGKDDPKMYLDPDVRNGISAFSNLISDEELDKGLTMLKNDLEDGTFQERTAPFDSRKGDYMFMVAKK